MSTVYFETVASWFDRLGGSSIKGSPEDPFKLRVLIAGYRVTPRHTMFQYLLEFGSQFIPAILRHEPIDIKNEAVLTFVLPERWMSVHEQHSFIHRLRTHPQAKMIKSVDIITQNALMVGGLNKGSVALFQINGDDPEAGLLDSEMR